MHHGFVGYQGGVLLLNLVSAVGGSHLPRPFSFIERGVLRPARCLNALSFRETQGAPDRRNENCTLCRNTDAGHRIGVRLGRIMCNLSKRGAEASPLPKGLAFEIVDLLRVRNWADLHVCRMFIRLDHGVDGEQYEQVIALHTGTSSQRHLIMWRDAVAVFLQPLIGQKQRYGSVAKALESLGAGEEAIGVCGVFGWWFFAQQKDVVLSWSRAAIASCA